MEVKDLIMSDSDMDDAQGAPARDTLEAKKTLYLSQLEWEPGQKPEIGDEPEEETEAPDLSPRESGGFVRKRISEASSLIMRGYKCWVQVWSTTECDYEGVQVWGTSVGYDRV
jgi:hypothetical protein